MFTEHQKRNPFCILLYSSLFIKYISTLRSRMTRKLDADFIPGGTKAGKTRCRMFSQFPSYRTRFLRKYNEHVRLI